MREVRYTNAPTLGVFVNLAMLVLAATFAVALLRQIVLDVYSSSFAGNLKIGILGLAFIYAVRGIMTWYERRNKVAFALGPAGIWTEETGWLAWQIVEFKVDRWRDAVSVGYKKENNTYLLRWPLSELDAKRADLLRSCHDYRTITE